MRLKPLMPFLVLAFTFACQRFDDSAIWDKLREHEERIEMLEEECNRLNSNISALQAVLEAVQANDYVTDITKIMENGVEVGYSITFAKSGTVTVYHGSDGQDAAAPKIGMKKAADGEYYWTADDEWMTDADGEKIPVVAQDPNGKYITPLFRVAEDGWYISYDNGNTWKPIGNIEDSEGDSCIFSNIEITAGHVIFHLSDGTSFRVSISSSQHECGAVKVKEGLTVAIIGDSISTHPYYNASEVTIEPEDIGVELSAFITYYDVDKRISLDGISSSYIIKTEDIGSELHFIPCIDDIGKKLGSPVNYNSDIDVWWLYAAKELGFTPIAATWSGSSITSHTSTPYSAKAISYAWHDGTIRKLGRRIPGTMERIAPDVVLIYRGTNDLSHSKKVRLTEGYFDDPDWCYPTTDELGDGTYGFKEGLSLTIKKIRETYPKARIGLCTCNTFKRNDSADFPTNNGNFSIPQMNKAIREVADFFGCHVIDLDKCGITFENCYESGYITDSESIPTHPNESGHRLLGQQAVNDLINKMHIQDIDPIHQEDNSVEDGDTPTEEPSENLMDMTARLDENTVFAANTSSRTQWGPFRGANLSIVDGCVRISCENTTSTLAGIRMGIPESLAGIEYGTLIEITFSYRKDSSYTPVGEYKFYVDGSSASSFLYKDDWREFRKVYKWDENWDRLQISAATKSQPEAVFYVKDFCMRVVK